MRHQHLSGASMKGHAVLHASMTETCPNRLDCLTFDLIHLPNEHCVRRDIKNSARLRHRLRVFCCFAGTMAYMLHLLILTAALVASALCTLPASSRRDRFLQEVPGAPAPGPDSVSAEHWRPHGSGWGHYIGSDSWYLPEIVHLLEEKVEGIVENDTALSSEVSELKEVVKKENATLTDLFQQFEELKVSPCKSSVLRCSG